MLKNSVIKLSENLKGWLNNPELAAPSLPIKMDLNNYAVLVCQGPDAKKFLQGQLTCDLEAVNSEQAQIGAYCDHKGRMLASFWVGQNQQDYLLVFPRNIYDNFYQELKKFAAFSKVQLSDVSADYQQIGLASITSDQPVAPTIKYIYKDSIQHILLPKTFSHDLSNTIIKADPIVWELLNIRLGIIFIVPETIGLFTPHEVNFAQIGGVSFNKGCYRGQEIIARMHYLGKLKQHLYHCSLQSSKKLNAGMELLTAEKQHLGKVVNCVDVGGNYHEILAVMYDAIVADQQQIKLANGDIARIIKTF